MNISPHSNVGETATCRFRLATWCRGAGIDIGSGGAAPIVDTAICIDKSPAGPWGGRWPVHLIMDAFQRLPFERGSLDYVYSSHCLEDAIDTAAVLFEWCQVIRRDGYLVLFLPDQEAYEAYCRAIGQLPNQDHKHKNFNMSYVADCLPTSMHIVHSFFPLDYNPYSFELVSQKML
jgi:hypothetical protein